MRSDSRYGTAGADAGSAMLADYHRLSILGRRGLAKIITQVYKSEQFQLAPMRTMLPRMASDGRQGLVPGLGRVGLAPLAVSKFTSAAKPRHANTSN